MNNLKNESCWCFTVFCQFHCDYCGKRYLSDKEQRVYLSSHDSNTHSFFLSFFIWARCLCGFGEWVFPFLQRGFMSFIFFEVWEVEKERTNIVLIFTNSTITFNWIDFFWISTASNFPKYQPNTDNGACVGKYLKHLYLRGNGKFRILFEISCFTYKFVLNFDPLIIESVPFYNFRTLRFKHSKTWSIQNVKLSFISRIQSKYATQFCLSPIEQINLWTGKYGSKTNQVNEFNFIYFSINASSQSALINIYVCYLQCDCYAFFDSGFELNPKLVSFELTSFIPELTSIAAVEGSIKIFSIHSTVSGLLHMKMSMWWITHGLFPIKYKSCLVASIKS